MRLPPNNGTSDVCSITINSAAEGCCQGEIVRRVLRYAGFEVRGERARQLGRLIAGLPLNSLDAHKAERLGSEGSQVAELPTND